MEKTDATITNFWETVYYVFKYICGKVFKSGPSKFFKGCLSQILLDPFSSNLTHVYFYE